MKKKSQELLYAKKLEIELHQIMSLELSLDTKR